MTCTVGMLDKQAPFRTPKMHISEPPHEFRQEVSNATLVFAGWCTVVRCMRKEGCPEQDLIVCPALSPQGGRCLDHTLCEVVTTPEKCSHRIWNPPKPQRGLIDFLCASRPGVAR
jgi:hypothetical protein